MRVFEIKTQDRPFWHDMADTLAGGDVMQLARIAQIGVSNFRRYLEGSDVTMRVLERTAETMGVGFLVGDKTDGPIIQFSNEGKHIHWARLALERYIGKELTSNEVARLAESNGDKISSNYFYLILTGARGGSIQKVLAIANALNVRFLICKEFANTLIDKDHIELALDGSGGRAQKKQALAEQAGFKPFAFDAEKMEVTLI